VTRPLRLLRGHERRLLAGHLWVYANEVDKGRTPLKAFAAGEPARVEAANGRHLGFAYVNPHSLICARITGRSRPLDKDLLNERLGRALKLRERLHAAPFYRLVFGEGDLLPGLVVDRYGDILVVQVTTAGMERLRDSILDLLWGRLRPQAVVLRNDTSVRGLEGLTEAVETLGGAVPDEIELEENGARFLISPLSGQKTGWFYDQADNRARLRRYVGGGRVLDVCSYVGGWGIQAALAGATEVRCLDASAQALEWVGRNALLNDCDGRVQGILGDAFDGLRMLAGREERFDLVILDPPAFIKRRKDVDQGENAYLRLNRLALDVLAPGGVLVSCSCSHHLPGERLQRLVQRASRRADRPLQLLEVGHQSADHPVHPAMPETAYLKALFLRDLTDK